MICRRCLAPDCGYHVGACLVPSLPAHHGLPIDLMEPDAPALVGDRVPCHLFMPEVAWHIPVGPVIRVWPHRNRQLFEPRADLLEPADIGFVAAMSAATWCLAVVALALVFLKGWQ